MSTFADNCFTIVLRRSIMPTLKAVVLKHQIREDNTYNIKIRVTHDRKSAYISTEHYISTKQITKDCKKIKDEFILSQIDLDIARLRKEVSKLGTKVGLYSAKSLAEYLSKTRNPGSGKNIDYFKFTDEKVKELKAVGRISIASNYSSAANNLRRWLKRDYLDFKEITVKFLEEYKIYLKSREDMGSRGLENNLESIRAIFNFARLEYNDEDLDEILIPHYPFAKFKIPKSDIPEKRSLEADFIYRIRHYKHVPKNKYGIRKDGIYRADIARDIFLLSFYLVGMNGKDLFELAPIDGDRIVYQRSKSKDRRGDKAEISIKIEPEAKAILDKYKDPDGVRALFFYKRYSNDRTFNTAINKGLKIIGNSLSISKLEFYAARHSWATIARNKCNVSKDDVDLCLNHVDQSLKMADVYIEKDWSKIDKANTKVLKLIRRMQLKRDGTL